jgi:hypothetical protein
MVINFLFYLGRNKTRSQLLPHHLLLDRSKLLQFRNVVVSGKIGKAKRGELTGL